MKRTGRPPRRWLSLPALLPLLALPAAAAPLSAQDFLFRDPRVTLGVRFGYAVPTASSDIFDDTRDLLTVERSDFNSAVWATQLAVRVTPRVDVALDVGFMRASTHSEFRHWVDTDDRPIEQVTEFDRTPVTLGAKMYFRDRGRSIGRFAWIPERWAPYVGAGAGYTWYRFEQDGDFVDFETLDIFPDRFVSEGKAATVYGAIGAEFSLGRSLLLTADGRYTWARGEMGSDFIDFDRMDLSGFQASAGLSIRF